MDIDMNNIKMTYRGHIISIAHHLMDGVTAAREVAIIYDDVYPIEIVARFDDSVESLEEAIEMAKAIINEGL